MSTIQNGPAFYIRQSWLGTIIDRMQAAAGRVMLLDRIDAQSFVKAIPQSLPAPRCSAERVILQSVLLQFAGESGMALHARAHDTKRYEACRFVPCVHLQCLWRPRRTNPLDAFRAWADVFFRRFDEVHPLSPATHAAHVVRADCQKTWNVEMLARRVHTTSARLTRAFRHEYGMSVRSYQRWVRLGMAFGRLREEKNESVARELGFESQKNFYRMFKQLTGLTPKAFRDLPHQQAQEIIDAAHLMLGAPQATARMRREWASQTGRLQKAAAADSSRR
jgi:AraC-like DNA-binding protein